jgi:hypothetical protein
MVYETVWSSRCLQTFQRNIEFLLQGTTLPDYKMSQATRRYFEFGYNLSCSGEHGRLVDLNVILVSEL